MLIDHKNNHIFISGMTRSGKTYFAVKALSEVPEGVLFINIQNAEVPPKYVTADANEIDLQQIIKGLRSGEKINLVFSRYCTEPVIMCAIEYLAKELLRAGFTEQKPIYIMFDECQTLTKEAREAVRLMATRGLYLGCRCVFITQRPALADLTFYTQAAEQYIFQLGKGEREYFRAKGIDYDECLKKWEELGEHSYIYTNGFILEGRPKI